MRSSKHRLAPASLIAITATLVIAWPAGAGAVGCDLAVGPAQTEPADPVVGTFKTVLLLQNNGGQACNVNLSIQQLSHDLDGTPKYAPSDALTAAFTIDKTSTTIGEGHRDSVTLSGALPNGAHSVYLAVIAAYTSVGQASGSSVETRTRIASQFLLRGPKPWDERTQVTDVGFMPGGDAKHRTVYATVKDLGNVHVRPQGTVIVIDNGKTVATVKLEPLRNPPPAILPGLSRRLLGTWTLTGPVGNDVRLQAIVTGAGTTTRFARAVAFANGAPLVKAASLLLTASVDGAVHLSAIVKNTGNEPLQAALVTLVSRQDAKFERDRKAFNLPVIAPGETKTVSYSPDLPKGSYLVQGTVKDQNQLLDEKETGFAIGGAGVTHTTAKRNILLYVALALVVLAASGAVMGLRQSGWLRRARVA